MLVNKYSQTSWRHCFDDVVEVVVSASVSTTDVAKSCLSNRVMVTLLVDVFLFGFEIETGFPCSRLQDNLHGIVEGFYSDSEKFTIQMFNLSNARNI
jgi:hypothetical protein